MKKALVILAIVIIVPIFYQKGMALFKGIQMGKAMKAPPSVDMTTVKGVEILDKSTSTGRLEAKYDVEIVARINGWLQKRYFSEGAFVKKGQTLFLIEQNEYINAVNQANASVRQASAAFTNSQKELKRAAELVKEDFVSKSYYDSAVAKRDADRANLDVARAALAQAQLNLSYTRIVSPIDGKIGSIQITEGNLVNPQIGTLAKIVSTNPIYAYFPLKSEDLLRFKKNDASKSNDSALKNMIVQIKLADGSTYPENGKIEFVDNTIDQTTGTVKLRATFPNKENLLVPGDYLSVVASSTVPRQAIIVPQVAVTDSPDGFFVYVIDAEAKAQQKFIKIDNRPHEAYWVVIEGLIAGDRVVTKGLQKLRPGITVKINEIVDADKVTDVTQISESASTANDNKKEEE